MRQSRTNPGSTMSRRTLLRGAAAIALVAGSSPLRAATRSPWPKLAPPDAPRIDHSIEQLGRKRNDPYAWMKYVPEHGSRSLEALPPMLRDHLAAEMRYAEAMLAPLEPAKRRFVSRMMARVPETLEPPPLASDAWRYGTRLPAGSTHPVFIRSAAQGEEEILFDEAERARGHAYYRATDHQPSPDHRFYVWAEDLIGNDRHQICALDTKTGKIDVVVKADAYGYGGLTFAPSSRYLFWIWRDVHNRPTRLYRTEMGTDAAPVLVYEETDPAIFMGVARTAADGFVALTLAGPDMGEVRLVAASDETAAPRIVRPRRRGTVYEVNEWAGKLVMLTDADGAADRKLLSLDPVSFATVDELVPHTEGVPILSILPFERALVRLERRNGLHRLVLLHPDGRELPLDFDAPAFALEIVPSQTYRAREVRITFQTPADPPRSIDVDLVKGSRKVVGEERLRGYDPTLYKIERMEARASDGALIPLTVLSRRDATTKQPLLLTGYAAYGISTEPLFSLPATVLVDAGWRYAIAHARGGSEKGKRWYLDGRAMKKRNSMTDFIACAHHLCGIGYTEPKRVVAFGLSAGGLLVGGALNIEPGLWAGVIAQVPFVDMLNTMSDANHPLVPLFRPDWGDPLADPAAYDLIASISPYENVVTAPYPPVLTTAGLKDDRVPYWEPAKFVANIRRRSTSGNPAILQLDPASGHQASGDRESEFNKAATVWSFAEACVA
jgi:oligopeptidase B